MSATTDTTALPLRTHTLLGVCEAIGEDFGFNPLLLRVPFATAVLFNPTYAVVAYFALGLIVLASRLLFPGAAKAKATAVSSPAADNNADEIKLAA